MSASRCAVYAVLLASAAAAAAADVGKFDCANRSYPMQTVLNETTQDYELVELDLKTGEYNLVYTFDSRFSDTRYNLNAPTPSPTMNAMAYNQKDSIAYGLFRDSSMPSDDYNLCRLSADQAEQPVQCLCRVQRSSKKDDYNGGSLYAGAIHNDTYFVSSGGHDLFAVRSVSSLTVSTDDVCPGQWLYEGYPELIADFGAPDFATDLETLGLTRGDLIKQLGWNDTGISENYLKYSLLYVFDSNDMVIDWKPFKQNNAAEGVKQNYADLITYELEGQTYLVWLGERDASMFVMRVAGEEIDGYALIRTRLVWDDCNGCPGPGPFVTFGAGFKYVNEFGVQLYFAANSGVGVLKVDVTQLDVAIGACNWTTHACGLGAGTTVDLTRINAA